MSSSLQRLKSRLAGNIFGSSNKAAAVTPPDIGRGSQSPADTSHFSNAGSEFDYGVFQYPVSEITIAGNFKDIFKNIILADDLEFKYAVNSPTMLIEGMVVAGK